MANAHEHTAHRGFVPPKLPMPLNPALAKHAEARAAGLQNRIADAITRFAGSMAFVYFHIVWFAVWIDEQWKMVQEEDQQNKQLIELSKQILELTRAVHA
jgi:hypothetical protein